MNAGLQVQDAMGRTFRSLRLSLLSYCNLGCVYCVSGKSQDIPASNHATLPYYRLVDLIESMQQVLPLHKIRLTGGEPTLYKELIPLVSLLQERIGLPISMTTNGTQLKSLLPDLKAAGLHSINISLDAMSEQVYQKISRRKGLAEILTAIEMAGSLGMEVKLNTVVLKGYNDAELIALVEFARSNNMAIRFLELMRMGHLYSRDFETYFVSQHEILSMLSSRYSLVPALRKPSATASYWNLEEGGQIGIIANESEPFCSDCDRLRLDSYGNIYGCLSSDEAIAVHDFITPAALAERLQQALQQKQSYGFVGSTLSMLKIGG
ncbi:MAG: radical SAM protein [Cytophagaceae bacterium]|jgi:cyclic pyranopterin phosphate synthase|nr:radical SAM protein [Cytophagaceae bacterium]